MISYQRTPIPTEPLPGEVFVTRAMVHECDDSRIEFVKQQLRAEMGAKIVEAIGLDRKCVVEFREKVSTVQDEMFGRYGETLMQIEMRARLCLAQGFKVEYIYQPPTLLEDVRELWTTPWQRIRGRVAKLFKRK